MAVVTGNVELRRILLQTDSARRKHPAEDGSAALHLAAANGPEVIAAMNLEAAPMLASVGDSKDRTPLHLAEMASHVSLVRLLLEHRSPPNANSRNTALTAMQAAAHAGSATAIAALFSQGADIDRATSDPASPFVLALKNRNFGAALDLIVAGADLDATDLDGTTTAGDLFKSRCQERAESAEAPDGAESAIARLLSKGESNSTALASTEVSAMTSDDV